MAQTDLAVGTYLKTCLGEPTTFDVAGYQALTWLEVDDVVNIGAGGGSADTQEYTPLKSGTKVKRAGAISYTDRAIQMGNHTGSDTTQQLLKAGFDGVHKGKVFSWAIHFVDGTIHYFTATITSFADEQLEANTFMFANVTVAPTTPIVVRAGTDLWTLTYTANANGSIVGDAVQVVEDGEDGVAVYAAPAALYEFVSWSDASTENPRTDTNVTANITVSATFALA